MAIDVLGLREGNELAAALSSRAAAEIGVPALLIKGRSLEVHGLRRDRLSADVDVYVRDRGRAADLIAALSEQGWRKRPATLVASRATTHSASLIRDGWPNDIDVHWEYPGLSTQDGVAFDRLWSSRVPVQLAGVRCWIPDKASSIVLWALHSLRGNEEARHRLELEQLIDEVLPNLGPAEREELGARIVELAADHALGGVPQLAELIGDRAGALDEESGASWQRKLAHAHELTPWLQNLREARWSEWPFLLWRGFWPSARDLRLSYPLLVDTPIGRCKARWTRLRRVALRWRTTRGA